MRSHAAFLFLSAFVCISAAVAAHSREEAYRLTELGGQMTSADKDALEEQVARNPGDVGSRTKLLGYYFGMGRRVPDAAFAKQCHIVWLIENAPESEVLGLPYGQLHKILEPKAYEQAKQAWLKTIEASPENLSTLRNASSFFLLSDRALSEELLLKGQTLDAKDPHWPASLGRLYSLGMISVPDGKSKKTAAEKAFRQFELAYDLSNSDEQDALMAELAKTAFAAGLTEAARKFATKMLEEDTDGWNRGNRIHHGNLILGRIALSEGKVDEAKAKLILAGKTTGSPQLNSFGPNMLLAKELLNRGEKDVVLEYFELCKKFWSSPTRELEMWIEDVKLNRSPNFGGNLAY